MEATERPFNLVRLVGGGLGGQNFIAPWPLQQEVLIFDDWYDLDVVAIYNVHFPIYVKRGFRWANPDDQSVEDEAWEHLAAPTSLSTSEDSSAPPAEPASSTTRETGSASTATNGPCTT